MTKVLAIAVICLTIFLQHTNSENYKTTTIKGEKCYIYYVQQGEGFYGINRKFGVNRDEIVKYNPSAVKGLNRGQKLYIPIKNDTGISTSDTKEEQSVTAQGTVYSVHTVQRGENLYSISKKYDTSVSEIMRINNKNSIALQIGDTIKVPAKAEIIVDSEKTSNIISEREPEPEKKTDHVEINGFIYKTEKYVVQRHETLYSIAQKFKTTIDNIIACNPGMKSIAKNDVLNIPMTQEVKKVVAEYKAENRAVMVTDKDKKESTLLPNNVKKDRVTVAIIFPFRAESPTNHSKTFISFYKGFLLALDSLKHEGISVDVYTYDTYGKSEKVKEIISNPNLSKADIIFVPENNEDIKAIGTFAENRGIFVVNSFSVRNNDVNNNKYLIQGLIPSSTFYDTAAAEFVKSASNKEIIFLTDNGEKNDKQEFVNLASEYLRKGSKDVKNFSFNEVTDYEVLLPTITENAEIVLVASSSTRNGVAKSTAIAAKIKEARSDVSVSLFGYPEWQTYTKEYLEMFYKLNTTIFTRFYIQKSQTEWKEFESQYKKWYGEEKSKSLPVAEVLGFDAGIYYVKGIYHNKKEFGKYLETQPSSSIQTDFDFERISENGGYVNKSVYFIRFTPEFETIKEIVSQ